MNDHSLGECVEGTEGIRRLGSIRFGDLLVGCDSNGKPSSGEETRMHYAHRQRVKIWGEAQVVENDAELIAKLRIARNTSRSVLRPPMSKPRLRNATGASLCLKPK